jgi:hypothetical protein
MRKPLRALVIGTVAALLVVPIGSASVPTNKASGRASALQPRPATAAGGVPTHRGRTAVVPLSPTKDNGGMLGANWGDERPGADKGRVPGVFDERIVYAALEAIDQALEQALTARTETQQRWQLNQLRGLLLTLPSSGLGLEDSLRHLIRLLQTPMVDR